MAECDEQKYVLATLQMGVCRAHQNLFAPIKAWKSIKKKKNSTLEKRVSGLIHHKYYQKLVNHSKKHVFPPFLASKTKNKAWKNAKNNKKSRLMQGQTAPRQTPICRTVHHYYSPNCPHILEPDT